MALHYATDEMLEYLKETAEVKGNSIVSLQGV